MLMTSCAGENRPRAFRSIKIHDRVLVNQGAPVSRNGFQLLLLNNSRDCRAWVVIDVTMHLNSVLMMSFSRNNQMLTSSLV